MLHGHTACIPVHVNFAQLRSLYVEDLLYVVEK